MNARPAWVVALAWLAMMLILERLGSFAGDTLFAAMRVLLAVVIPPALFAICFASYAGFRKRVLAQNLWPLVRLQTLRVIGGVFLVLFALGRLPGLFALPAGIGDVAVGLAAAWMAYRPAGQAGVGRKSLAAWSLAGIFDLALAVTLGVLTSASPLGLLAGPVTSGEVVRFPLVVIPVYFVPAALVLHLWVLLILRKEAREEMSTAASG